MSALKEAANDEEEREKGRKAVFLEFPSILPSQTALIPIYKPVITKSRRRTLFRIQDFNGTLRNAWFARRQNTSSRSFEVRERYRPARKYDQG